MIEEFKDIIMQYFESQNKIVKRGNIVLLFYEEIKAYARGVFETTLPDYEYYEIIYDSYTNEFSLDIYQKIRGCRITKNEE